jgi:ABC-2 type transport system permease protein
MHIRSILAIARKDALDILLNKSTLTILLTPIFLAVLFVVIGRLLGGHTTNALVYNPARSGVEQVIDGAFSDIKVTYTNSPADVAAAFGPDGSHKTTTYALGLVVPADFETSLRSGSHPQLNLFVDGGQVNNPQRQLLLSALADYSRSVANPQPPANITVATVNPPSSTNNAVQDIGQIYAVAVLLSSFLVGTTLVPGLLAEEKEKKTLRMLMVSPASFADVVAGKLLVGLIYQLVLAIIAVGITGGLVGQVPLLLFFLLLGSFFGVSLGLLVGSIFQTTTATGAFSGMISIIYVLPVFFVGSFGQLLGNNPFSQAIKGLPTYYIADGAANAIRAQSTFNGTVLDISIVLASIVALFLVAVWLLRRQAVVASTI